LSEQQTEKTLCVLGSKTVSDSAAVHCTNKGANHAYWKVPDMLSG